MASRPPLAGSSHRTWVAAEEEGGCGSHAFHFQRGASGRQDLLGDSSSHQGLEDSSLLRGQGEGSPGGGGGQGGTYVRKRQDFLRVPGPSLAPGPLNPALGLSPY